MLERFNDLRLRPRDDQVIYVHTDDELFLPLSSRVERMFCGAAREPKLTHGGIELGVPRPWSLPQPVKGLPQP
jgi:hypothetical protein